MANPNQLAALIPDPLLPSGHPLGSAWSVSELMPVYVEPTAGGCADEFRKAIVASARQTIRAEEACRDAHMSSMVRFAQKCITELRNARELAEAILQELGESP